jgi:hypothetical protein
MQQKEHGRETAGWSPVARFCRLAARLVIFPCLPALLWAMTARGQTVPILGEGDMILVPVQGFNRTLHFIVDTGFTISAVDTAYQSYLGNQVDTYTAVSPLGQKDVPVYPCPALSIAGQPVALEEVVQLDLTRLRQITGQPCDGILGSDWFAKNVVAIDFDNHTLTLEKETPEIVKQTFVPVSVSLTNGYYLMGVDVNHHPFDLMIDTGDSGSLSLNQHVWQEVFGTNQTKTAGATVADAVNNVAQTEVGVVAQMSVAGLNYRNLHAMLIKNARRPSRLGLRFFQRHNVTFDFAAGRLYLQPDRDFAMPDVEDMSGLHLLRYGQKIIVYSVNPHSPAAAQGIRASDVIEAVNHQPVTALKIETIRQMLRSGNGAQVALQIRRGDARLDVKIVLKKTI